MIIQATPYGTKKEEPFAFTYSGDFTDERVDGIGDVTLNTSGQLVTTGQTVIVSVYILAGGGGAAAHSAVSGAFASGGSGGNQTVEVELVPGTYEIIIGTGGAKGTSSNSEKRAIAGNGGNTVAFGQTCTGGTGANTGRFTISPSAPVAAAGTGGTPNGKDGTTGKNAKGGSPNGGSLSGETPSAGGNGLVRITFS